MGYGTSLALLVLDGIAATAMVIGLKVEIDKRERGERDYRLHLGKATMETLGDDHPSFQFTY
jgi:hypothetical protein